jgi:P4 family phage/plasmid primase-like protien
VPNTSVSQILREQYQLEAQAGAKIACPFCHHHSFSIKRDDTLAKCFHGSCGRFLTIHGPGASDTITLSSVLAEIYHDFHQELLHLKDVTYPDNAYSYVVKDRKIHPRVVEDAMLGAIPSEYDLDSKFAPLIDSIHVPRTPPPKGKGRPKKYHERTPEEQRQWIIEQREKLRTCLLKHAGWLAFFHTDTTHRIASIRFRKPGTRYFTYFKPYQAGGLFGHGLFSPYELNGLQAYNQYLIVMEGEFNPLQLQSLLMRRAEASSKDPGYVFAAAVGGVDNTDWASVHRLVQIPILVHDHDSSGEGWVENARQFMAVDVCTTPTKDLDEYIRTFGDRYDDAWDAVRLIIKNRQRLHRLYSGTGMEFFDQRGFIPKRLGDAIMERHHLKYSAERLWVYCDGVYHPNGEITVKQEAHALLGERRHESHIQETLRYLEVETDTPPPEMNPDVINLQNGRLQWRTKTLMPHTPEIFEIVQLPFMYDPDATCQTFDHYCQTTFCTIIPGRDPDIHHDVIKLIEELFGNCVARDTRWEKTFMLLGGGENGKSVLLDVLSQMLGPDHVSHVALQDLTENRFQAAELLGKLANIFADLDARALTSTTHFKMLTTGDPITAERKHERPFTFKNYAQMVFSANRMPPSRDRSHAYYRRWAIIPFTRTFRDQQDGRDPRLREKLYQELPGIFNRALVGLTRLYAQEGFTIPKLTQDALGAYQRDNDTVSAFAKECLEPSDTGKIAKQDLFRIYRRWCAREGFKAVNQRELRKSLTQLFPKLDEWRESSGRGTWHWIHITLTDDGQSINMAEEMTEDDERYR